MERVKSAWRKLGITPETVVVDFINVTPRYEWTIEKRSNVDVGVEKRAGYRMQTNLHLAVSTEAKAQAALAISSVPCGEAS